MKPILNFLRSILVLIAVAGGARAQTPAYLQQNWVTGGGVSVPTTFTPVQLVGIAYPNVTLGGPVTVNPTNGYVLTNLLTGPYVITFQGYTRSLTVFVPDLWITNYSVNLPVNLADSRWQLGAPPTTIILTNSPGLFDTNGAAASAINTLSNLLTAGLFPLNLLSGTNLPISGIQGGLGILTNNYAGNVNLNGTNYLGANVTEGAYTTASGQDAHAEGSITTASGLSAHAEGSQTVASGFSSHAGGYNAYATNDNTFVWGDGSATVGSTTNKQLTFLFLNGYRLLGGAIADSTGTVPSATNIATKTTIAAAGYQTAAQVTTAIGAATNVLTGSNAPNSAFTVQSITGTHYGNGANLTGVVISVVTNNNLTALAVNGNNSGYTELNVQDFNPAGSSDFTATADNGNPVTNYFNVGINGSKYVPGTGVLGSTNDTYEISVGQNWYEDLVGSGVAHIWVSQASTNAPVTTNLTLNASGLVLNTGQFAGNGGGLTNIPTIQFRQQQQARAGVNIGDRIVAVGNWWNTYPNSGGALVAGDNILPGGTAGAVEGGGTNSYSWLIYTNCAGSDALVTGADFGNPQLLFSNIASTGYAAASSITVDATMEYPVGSGLISRFYVAGNSPWKILPDCLVRADLYPPINVPAGAAFKIRTFASVPATNFTFAEWRANNRQINYNITGQTTNGNNVPDWTGTNGAEQLTYANATAGYGPSSIIAQTAQPCVSVGIMGDSEIGGGTPYYLLSGNVWEAWPLFGAFTNQVPLIQAAISGNALYEYFPGTGGITTNRMEMQLLSKSCTDVVVELFSNDSGEGHSVAEIETNYLKMGWFYFNRGVRPWAVTGNPRCGGTFAATNTQTHVNYSTWLAVNQWLMTQPAPYFGTFNQCQYFDALGGTNFSGYWVPNSTTDGLHPAATAFAQTNWLSGWAYFITNTIVAAANK